MIGVIKGTMRQKKEVTGLPLPIASYKANMKAPIRSLKVAITAKQSGSGTPAPDNIRPISGVSAVNVIHYAKNMFDLNYLSASGITIQNGEASGTVNNFNAAFGVSTDGLKSKFKFKPNTSYTISFKAYTDGNSSQSGNGLAIYFRYTDNSNLVITVPNNTLNYTYFSQTSLSSKSLENILISYATSGANIWHIKEIQLEENASATDYEPYTGNTYTIQLGDTYYGGSLDVTTGVLTVTHNIVTYSGTEEGWVYRAASDSAYRLQTDMKSAYNYQNGKCNIFPLVNNLNTFGCLLGASNNAIYINKIADLGLAGVDEFKTWLTTHNMTVVYPLATPITVQLTPTQVEQMLGANNVFADCGDVEELIYTDRQVYYGR